MRVRGRNAGVVLLLAAVAVAGCGEGDLGVDAGRAAGAGTPTTASAATSPGSTVPGGTEPGSTAPSSTMPGDAVVEVLDPGAEPRSPLRLAFVAGDVFEQENEVRQVIKVLGQRVEQTVRSVSRHTIVSVSNGTATIEVAFTDISGSTPGFEDLSEQIAGITATFVVDDRGRIIDARFDVDSVDDPFIRQLFEGLVTGLEGAAFVLPEEPVGVGARWRVTSVATSAGIPTMLTQDVSLTARDDVSFAFDVAATFDEGGDVVDEIPGLPAGASIEDLQIDGSMDGSGDFTLAAPVPSLRATSSIAIEYVLVLDGDEQDVTTSVEMEQRTTVTRA